jgi:cation diffusion facilitator family transporter
MSDCDCHDELDPENQRKVLTVLLMINGFMFLFEFIFALIADSTGLLADSLDMLADSMVYAIAIYAVGRSARIKSNAAMLSATFQMLLGLGVLFEVIRRFMYGSEPMSLLMIIISLIALAANVICLVLLSKHKQGEVHMRASWIFSKNDVIANVGVITAGILVAYSGSSLPDLIIGAIIVSVVLHGSYQIFREAIKARVDGNI